MPCQCVVPPIYKKKKGTTKREQKPPLGGLHIALF